MDQLGHLQVNRGILERLERFGNAKDALEGAQYCHRTDGNGEYIEVLARHVHHEAVHGYLPTGAHGDAHRLGLLPLRNDLRILGGRPRPGRPESFALNFALESPDLAQSRWRWELL